MSAKVLAEIRRLNKTLRGDSWSLYQTFLRELFGTTECEFSSEALPMLDRGDFNGILALAERMSTTEFRSRGQHRLNVQMISVVRKYPFPKGVIEVDPERRAIEKFLKSEHRCKRINERFSAYRKVRSPNEDLLNRARNFIQYVLGDFSLSAVQEDCDFSTGAAIGIHGNATNFARKMLSKSWTVTPGAYYYARAALKRDFHIVEAINGHDGVPLFSWDLDLFNKEFENRARIVDNNKVTFVPKTALTHRAIAVEPLLNGYLQKGVDSFMRKRLKRVGIDLKDQSINASRARQGSAEWRSDDPLCTIDLSSASDSVSTELCRALLPPDWFEYLNSIRSHGYSLCGKKASYHKFVSMGNGFCFPLETLIFASLCSAVSAVAGVRPDFSVYGDDIIVRRSVFEPLIKALDVCGFRVNVEKTFSSGPFRESCGADWFEGEDVRPVLLDYAFDSFESIVKFCNIVRSKDSWLQVLGPSLKVISARIPRSCLLVRPYKGTPESALEVEFDEFVASPFSRWNTAVQAWEWVELQASAVPDDRVRRFARYQVALMRGALTGVESPVPFTERFTSRTKLRKTKSSGAEAEWTPRGSGWLRCLVSLPAVAGSLAMRSRLSQRPHSG